MYNAFKWQISKLRMVNLFSQILWTQNMRGEASGALVSVDPKLLNGLVGEEGSVLPLRALANEKETTDAREWNLRD